LAEVSHSTLTPEEISQLPWAPNAGAATADMVEHAARGLNRDVTVT
jgi:hypothetical protein